MSWLVLYNTSEMNSYTHFISEDISSDCCGYLDNDDQGEQDSELEDRN